ncbi:hypothetical protein JOQ06_011417, partial [Pogonophryne albipinna]
LREVALPPWPFMSLSAKPHGRVSLLLLGPGGATETGPSLAGTARGRATQTEIVKKKKPAEIAGGEG